MQLYSYQTEVVERSIQHNILLADETGVGKTFTAIGCAIKAHEQYKKPVLVVCKKTLLAQWQHELQRFNIDSYIISNKIQKSNYYLINYERIKKFQKELNNIEFSMIILDEAHLIKNRQTIRAKQVKKLKSIKKMALTATIFDKSLAETWSILHFLYPKVFKSYYQFETQYVVKERNYMGYEIITGSKNLDDFYLKVKDFFFQRTKKELRHDLPDLIIKPVILQFEPWQSKIYNVMKKSKHIRVNLDIKDITPLLIKNELSKMLHLQKITSAPKILGIDKLGIKIEYLKENIDDIAGKIIILTYFRESAKVIYDQLDKNQAVLVLGGIDNKESINNFKNSKNTKILIGTIGTIAEGHDFGFADTIIFVDFSYNSIMMQQAINRIYRININCDKLVLFLLVNNTIDKIIYDSYIKKNTTRELVYKFLTGK